MESGKDVLEADDEQNCDENNIEVVTGDDSIQNGEPNVKETKKRSGVWLHFTEIIENGTKYAKCNHCEHKKYKVSGKVNGSTGNMTKHVAKKHEDQLLTLDEDNIAFVFSQENFRKALLKWVVLCNQPFTEIQQKSFVEVVNSLNPDAELVSDKTLRANVIDTYEAKLKELKVLVSEIPGKISFTMDGWISKNVLPFLGIRGHWLDKNWNYQSQQLAFAHIVGDHSGLTLQRIFIECLSRLDIPFAKVLGITLDNASNNDTFFDWNAEYGILSDTSHIRCLAHIINLDVQQILLSLKIRKGDDEQQDQYELEYELEDDLEHEELADIDLNEEIVDITVDEDEPIEDELVVLKLRKLVKKIRKSVKLRQKFKKLCGMYNLKYLVPILDVSTRWNSTHDMIVRADHLKIPLRTLCSDGKALTSLNVTDSQCNMLHDIQILLATFHRATQLASMERHSTIHAYLPTMNWLSETLANVVAERPFLSEAASKGLDKLKEYEHDMDTIKLPFFATILNPALKLNYFKEYKYGNANVRDLKRKFTEYFSSEYDNPLQATENCDSEEPEDDFYAHMFKRSKIDKVSSEVEKYLSQPLSNKKVKTSEYWLSRQDEFPHLSKMAMDFQPIQSASVAVERDFSQGSHVTTPTRCLLKPDIIEATMCLKSWFQNDL